MDYNKEALLRHEKYGGKITIGSKFPLEGRDDLSVAYTPGVAEPCREIAKDPELAYKYTAKKNLVAVVSDGSAVLGLGNIGAKASIPVMEGKSVLFKFFADVDAVPICLDTQDTEELIRTVQLISPCFGGINLEDISAPRCFEIEERLKEILDIPVFHDDQHGTAIVVAAAMINALKIVKKPIADAKIVVSGFGAAGVAIIKLLLDLGAKNIVVVGRNGIVSAENTKDKTRTDLIKITNPNNEKGSFADAMDNSDVFIGVSGAGILTKDLAARMAKDSIVLAMANPIPEIMPDVAKEAGVRIVGTGRSDFANQVNNSLCFPAIFRGALDARAKTITEEMKRAAVFAIANLIEEKDLNDENIIPSMFDERVVPVVAKAVAEAWTNSQK